MHIEIQVALNFVISYLYNKLPRRRVNLFGEELEKAIKHKFDGHWYPEKPFKGSAYRCLRIGSPIDPVLETAARESGVELPDIRENLPEELSVWIDPGEVSYRIGEKGVVKILYAAAADDLLSGNGHNGGGGSHHNHHSSHHLNHDDVALLDREVTRSFNPEAQCFKPIVEAVAASLGNLTVHVQSSPNHVTASCSSSSTSPFGSSHSPTSPSFKSSSSPVGGVGVVGVGGGGGGVVGVANGNGANNNNGAATATVAATAPFLPNSKSVIPLTFTTATFAQTKFGSTKLKTNSKRSNRMSPTEFSNYIKQRALLQQQTHVPPPGLTNGNSAFFAPVAPPVGPASPQPPQRPRSLSPINPQHEQQHFRFLPATGNAQQQHHQQQQQHLRGLFDSGYLGDLFSANASNNGGGQQAKYPSAINGVGGGNNSQATDNSPFLGSSGMNDNSKTLLDGINFNLNTMPYPNQHQHLLVAN